MPQIEMIGRSDRLSIGSLTYHVCENLIAIEAHHRGISDTMRGYLHDFDLGEDYPMAFLKWIGIDQDLRKKGHGSKLLREFD